jgi:hypothetical protein
MVTSAHKSKQNTETSKRKGTDTDTNTGADEGPQKQSLLVRTPTRAYSYIIVNNLQHTLRPHSYTRLHTHAHRCRTNRISKKRIDGSHFQTYYWHRASRDSSKKKSRDSFGKRCRKNVGRYNRRHNENIRTSFMKGHDKYDNWSGILNLRSVTILRGGFQESDCDNWILRSV